MFNGNTTVTNKSSYTVSFIWGGITNTLEYGETASIDYSYVNINIIEPTQRVYLKYIDEHNREIHDLQSYEVRVLNLTKSSGVLTADGWMEEILFVVSEHEQTDITWLLFRVNPKFTAITNDGFLLPVIFLRDGNIFKVTIGAISN